MVTYETLLQNERINVYIRKSDEYLAALLYTEHSFAHVGVVARMCRYILSTLRYPERTVQLAEIAAYLHDIGNLVNRNDHCQSGALMAAHILT